MSHLTYTIDLLTLLGIEAECISSLTFTSTETKLSSSRSEIYCSDIRGTCTLPLTLSATSTVIYYMGITDSNGYLDKTEGYMYSSSSSSVTSLTCAGDASNLLSDGTATIEYGFPGTYSTY